MVVLDTDAMSVWLNLRDPLRIHLQRRYTGPAARGKVTTVVSFQEQTRGWLAKINVARTAEQIVRAYKSLADALDGYGGFRVLDFDHAAQTRFEDFRRQKIRVPTLDLRIACIAIVNNATLFTRNTRDFRQVPALTFEDWPR